MPHLPASTPLQNIRVLDLTRVRAGPTCVRMLADFGADVIKIEAPPGKGKNDDMGGPRDDSDFQNLHRNKRAITLDLRTTEGLAVFKRMVEQSDVVTENFRPDVKTRLGIDYPALQQINRRIILASVSGFGQDGPYAKRPGFDQIAQGMGGLMHITGLPGQGPMRAGIAVADSSAGLYAALGVMIALIERAQSGEGQWVQSSLLQAQIAMNDFQAVRYLVKGEVPAQTGNDHPTSMPTSVYRTSDGYINIAAAGQEQWFALCQVLRLPELADHDLFADGAARARNRAALNKAIGEATLQATSEELIRRLNAAGVPCGPIYKMDEVFADPQVQHLGAAAPVVHPRLGELNLIAQPVKLSRTPAGMRRASPDRGEHNLEVLREFGFSDVEIAGLQQKGVI
jgi:formyl-CoA transferase